jgi:5-methylcytosine-specific restriction endonuclease McrA
MANNKNKEEYNAYMRGYLKTRHKERKAAAIAKLGGKCARCPATNDLELDHIDPSTKSFTIGKSWIRAIDDFWAEVAKCQLLCDKCHNLKTTTENGLVPARGTHGTLSALRYCKPPCDVCKAAKREYMQEYAKTHVRKRDRK